MARETINGLSMPIPGTGEPGDFQGELRRIATDIPNPIAEGIADTDYIEGMTPQEAIAYRLARAQTEGRALADAVVSDGGTVTIVFTTHSLGYGQDTTSATTTPAVNGSALTRSTTPPPETFALQLTYLAPGITRVVVNQGYPGDQTGQGSGNAWDRWAAGTSGDLEIFWLDANDANNYAGFATGKVSPENSAAYLGRLIRRAQDRGAAAAVVGGAPIKTGGDASRRVLAYSSVHKRVAEQYGALFLDVAELMRGLTQQTGEIWPSADTVHLSPNAYAIIGSRLAALNGPRGLLAPRAAAGTIIHPRHHAHVGGTVTARADALDGYVVRLTAGQVMAVPIEVTEPVQVIVEFLNDTSGNGAGTGRMYYNTGQAGRKNRPVLLDMGNTSYSTFVAGYIYAGQGPDTVVIGCDTGALQVASIRFVPAMPDAVGLHEGETNAEGRKKRSGLAGMAVTAHVAGTWTSVVDEHTPLSIVRIVTGTTTEIVGGRVEFDLSIPEASGRVAGVLLCATRRQPYSYAVQSGYIIRRNAAAFEVVKMVDNVGTTIATVAAVFPASGRWEGTLSCIFATDGSLAIYVDDTLRHTVAAADQPWRHFIVGAGQTAALGALAVRACTVTANAEVY